MQYAIINLNDNSWQFETNDLAEAERAKTRAIHNKRVYPRFLEGQSTAEYVEGYWHLNGAVMGLACSHNYRTGASTPLSGEVQRLINGLYEPLSEAPQHTPTNDTLIEETV